ncbi:MAG: hypothetical protein KKE23_00745 [Nanoarchaeota archaeon]|nr:hypothetical protein [Nanoarchaeota archaeon]
MPEIKEGENLLDILKRTKAALNSRDAVQLKDLSNRTIHTASIYQDPDSIAVAVIVYSLSKIIERSDYSFYKGWSIFMKIVNHSIEKSVESLEEEDYKAFRDSMVNIRKAVDKISGNLKFSIQEVFYRAMINKASRLYEHGISIEQTANILGVSLFELSEYAGKTGISEVPLNITMPIEKRFKTAWEFLS